MCRSASAGVARVPQPRTKCHPQLCRGYSAMAIQARPRSHENEEQSLHAQGLEPSGSVHWNLVGTVLIEAAVRRGEGELADMGPFVAVTAPHTGRSPNDKFVVKDASTENDVAWGKVNQPLAPDSYGASFEDIRA